MARWKAIPISFSEFASRVNDAGDTVYSAVLVINTRLYLFMTCHPARLEMLKQIIVDVLNQRLKTDRNPLKSKRYYY
jgi:hypothetical protein